MPKINEATDTDLKVIERLQQLGWKPGDTLLYQQEYSLTPEQQKVFEGKKSIKPDITLTDLSGNILAVFEDKFEDEKKALTKLRTLYATVLKPRFLYACSPERTLFYDTEWKGLDAGEFRQVNGFMSLEEMRLKIEQAKKINLNREVLIDKTIAGGINPSCGKETYFQIECIETLLQKYKEGKQKMLVNMATGLGKTRTMVAFVKALLEYNMAKRVLFVVDRVMLADQTLNDGFSLISKEFSAVRITSSNYRQYKNAQIHIVVIDTLENIYQNIPSTFYDLNIVDECHRSININRKLIFDHFLCPRIGLTATPRKAIAAKGKDISEEDLAILDTYKLFGCEIGEPDYQFDLTRGIDEGFLAPYQVLSIETELTKLAREKGVEFSYVLDPDERRRIELDQQKKLMLEQLERKYISEDRCLRIAEEIKAHTEYGEKVLLFGVSQAHCTMLTKALNKVFATSEDEASPRYAEAIISDNNDLNATFKKWFKDINHKPFIAVSVDIMGTGVDIPCVRYISFAALTKSVGKYVQMLGRGTRLDPKTGKFSFKVLDFVGLCAAMEDNGKGTPKPNIKVVDGKGGGDGRIYEPKGEWFIIDNPDPAHLIQRVYLHGDKIQVIDNVPIEKARALFEEGLENADKPEIIEIKKKVEKDKEYEPSADDVETIKDWAKKPEVYLDEGQLQKVYDFKQGSIWDFFLHALKIKKIPTPKERIEHGFDSYLKTYNFNDDQIHILQDMKDIFAENITQKRRITAQEIFDNPVYMRIIGADYQEINQKFDNRLSQVFEELQTTFSIL
ncbi:MAG: DEAD/DEAH box helicase family protein [Candidatus Brocadia sp.]|nr:DEAD/DEAH box helicase family protein [Candidatus Brocadia sp.]